MATHDPYIQLDSLPEEVRKKVLDFIASLMEQWEQKEKSPSEPKPRKRMIAGLAEGKVIVPDDFNEPLDDFKEYME